MSKILRMALGAMAVGSIFLHSSATMATIINEVEPNDTGATAQDVSGAFSLDFSADIGDAASVNTSTSLSHVSILGTGNSTNDFFSFSSLGGLTILDIDYGTTGGFTDTEIGIWNSAGSLLAFNDDVFSDEGAGGSTSFLDAFIQLDLASAGTYTVGVCQFDCIFGANFSMTGSTVASGADYTLQISTATATVPEPSVAALLALGLTGLGFARRRKHS